jgi:hypothetical protein
MNVFSYRHDPVESRWRSTKNNGVIPVEDSFYMDGRHLPDSPGIIPLRFTKRAFRPGVLSSGRRYFDLQHYLGGCRYGQVGCYSLRNLNRLILPAPNPIIF